jgi:predicted aspartyl protease
MKKQWLAVLCSLFMQALTAHAASRCQFTRIHDMNVEVSGGRVVVAGSVNRHEVRLMLDTGSNKSFIDQALATELELPRRATDRIASGANGIKYIELAHVQEISVGGMSGGKIDLAVLEDVGGSEGLGMLVGADLLMHTDIEFNLPGKEVSFFSPADCEHADLGYWDKNSQVVATVDSGAYDPRQVFDVLVNGQSVKAVIDSGAPRTSLDVDAAKRLGLTASSPGARTPQKKSQTIFTLPLDSIQIGDETIKHERVAVIDFDGGDKSETATLHPEGGPAYAQIELLLGLDFLMEHRVLFAVKEHKIFFSYVKPQASSE